MEATVSVSCPMCTAARSACWRWAHGSSFGTGVCCTAAWASWKAVTTNPLGWKRQGGSFRPGREGRPTGLGTLL
jgi:hypothetical protein